MIRLESITVSPDGRRVDYSYESFGKARKYLNLKESFYVEYDCDVSGCPNSILAIPFVSNFEPVGWFGGFGIEVGDLDDSFAKSRLQTRLAMSRMYPGRVADVGVHSQRCVGSTVVGENRLMLYSGGLDATASLLAHVGEAPIIVTVRGADIGLNDREQWSQCLRHIASSPITKGLTHRTVIANLRESLTHEVDISLIYGWWGKVQHGDALLGLLAPLSFVEGASTCYIASSYSVPVPWGSTKDHDETITWANVRCVHDAHDISRQKKAQNIVEHCRRTGQSIPLRVCYSEVARQGNCGQCEKCYRTILNLVFVGADPRSFGLPMDGQTYQNMLRLMAKIKPSAGMVIFWKEISAYARATSPQSWFYLDAGNIQERRFLNEVSQGLIDRKLQAHTSAFADSVDRIKFILRHRMPGVYGLCRRAARYLS